MENLDLNNPNEIYDIIQLRVKNVAKQIESLQQIANEGKVQEILLSQEKNTEKAINDLKKNSEWECFSIALFGETNAGKSTVIETLRILLNEETKCAEQKKFRDIQINLAIREKDFDKLNSDLDSATLSFLRVESRN